MKFWEIIADNLSKAGWSWGCISSTDHGGRQFWVVTAEREDAGRLSCTPMKCLLHFWNYRRQFIVSLNFDEVLGNHRGQSQQSRMELGLRLSH
jgi:hypothetical protein